MKKILSIFLLVGLVLLGFSGYLAWNSYQLNRTGNIASGEIIDYQSHYSREDNATYYYPIIKFSPKQGEDVTIVSAIGSSSPDYQQGHSIDLLYSTDQPHKAIIYDFKSIWLESIIIGVMGSVFFLVGLIPLLLIRRKMKLHQRLKHSGTPIELPIDHIEINNTISVNGVSPYRIIACWHDKKSNLLHTFYSVNIYYDPEPYIDRDTVTVFTDKNNMKKYYMDIDFLPKKSK